VWLCIDLRFDDIRATPPEFVPHDIGVVCVSQTSRTARRLGGLVHQSKRSSDRYERTSRILVEPEGDESHDLLSSASNWVAEPGGISDNGSDRR